MLYKQTVSAALYDTLKKLMEIEELSDFVLVGGTALSLQLGHRISVDIDLFTPKYPINQNIGYILRRIFPKSDINKTNYYIVAYIKQNDSSDLKVDLMCNEEFIRPPLIVENIRIAHIEDIAAMKLEAISSRKEKKDYWDIFQILCSYSFEQLIDFYVERYPYNDIKNVICGLGEIQLCDNQPNPVVINNSTWTDVKTKITKSLNDYIKKQLNL